MQQNVFTPDGYIVNQSAMRAPYGKHSSAYNGCGWIAAYNALRACGLPLTWEQVRNGLQDGLWLGGALGTGAFRLARYLRKNGLTVRVTLATRAARPKKCYTAGIVCYAVGKGLHYVAFVPQAQHCRFFNAHAGDMAHVESLEDFLRANAKPPLCLVLWLSR